ncbi:MAG: SDR family NAD(P)-dependent oxidoreductase [Candidatus Competibacterales bacterium]
MTEPSQPFSVPGLAGQVALITGASGGLGGHFAQLLAGHGASVVATGRRPEPLERLVTTIGRGGGRAMALPLDVTDPHSVSAAFDAVEGAFGPVTLLINNSGIVESEAAHQLSESQWEATLATNLTGAWRVAQELAKRLIEAQTPGNIVNIASILGYRVAGGVLPYAVSKAGLIQMTKALALEWARYGIRVNALAPGYIETDLNRDFFQSPPGQALIKRIPQRRLGQLRDLDGPLLLLASPAAGYMTGTAIVVDGGHLQSSL